jgi:hypothetical protein
MNNQNKLLKIKLNIPFLSSLLLHDVVLFNECINGTLLNNLKTLLLEGINEFVLRNPDNEKMQDFITNSYIINELFLYTTQALSKKLVLFSKLWTNLYSQNPNEWDYSLFKYLINLFDTYIKTNFPDYLNKSHSLNLIVEMVSKLNYANCNKLGDPYCSQSLAFLMEKKLQTNMVPENWWPEDRKQLYLQASDESEFIPNIVQLLNIMYLRMWCRDIYITYSYSIDIIDDYIIIEKRYKEKFLEVLRNYVIDKKRSLQLCYFLILQHFKPYPIDMLILIKNFRASLAKQAVKKAHILTLKSGKFDNSLITIVNDYSTI